MAEWVGVFAAATGFGLVVGVAWRVLEQIVRGGE